MYQSVENQKHIWSTCLSNYHGQQLYGYEWGDPESPEARNKPGQVLGNYLHILNTYLRPSIEGKHVLEIGSLAGKWVAYMEMASKITCVDITDTGFEYIKNNLPHLKDRLHFYLTSGDELSGVPSGSVDCIFSMDSLVRSEREIFPAYLREIRRVLSDNGKACLHLPCSEQHLSWELGFTPLTIADIKDMAIHAGFAQSYKIVRDVVNHGVLLLINF